MINITRKIKGPKNYDDNTKPVDRYVVIEYFTFDKSNTLLFKENFDRYLGDFQKGYKISLNATCSKAARIPKILAQLQTEVFSLEKDEIMEVKISISSPHISFIEKIAWELNWYSLMQKIREIKGVHSLGRIYKGSVYRGGCENTFEKVTA